MEISPGNIAVIAALIAVIPLWISLHLDERRRSTGKSNATKPPED